MAHRFHHHYTLDQARSLLPQVRLWFAEIDERRERLDQCLEAITPLLEAGHDCGGPEVNTAWRTVDELQTVVRQFEAREIQIKDVDRGLIDFPSLIDGHEVFLCWEKSEEDIEHWHELDAGYAGRQPLTDV